LVFILQLSQWCTVQQTSESHDLLPIRNGTLRSQDSSVSIVTWLHAGWSSFETCQGQKGASLQSMKKMPSPALRGTLIILFDGYRILLPGLKRPGRDIDHSPPSNLMIQQDATVFNLLYFCRQLYIFRVLTPTIRSWYSCNYSFWHWSTGSTTVRSSGWVGTVPDGVMTVVRAPDDGCQHSKYVELPTEM